MGIVPPKISDSVLSEKTILARERKGIREASHAPHECILPSLFCVFSLDAQSALQSGMLRRSVRVGGVVLAVILLPTNSHADPPHSRTGSGWVVVPSLGTTAAHAELHWREFAIASQVHDGAIHTRAPDEVADLDVSADGRAVLATTAMRVAEPAADLPSKRRRGPQATSGILWTRRSPSKFIFAPPQFDRPPAPDLRVVVASRLAICAATKRDPAPRSTAAGSDVWGPPESIERGP